MKQILQSDFRAVCPVILPYKARQKYMHTFDLGNPIMAEGYEDYFDLVVRLCQTVGATRGVGHMTVDEKIVPAGMSQRRPGPHVDGCFSRMKRDWVHSPGGVWLHNCNDIQTGPIARMPVIVAGSVEGCRVWRGEFVGQPTDRGDLSHIQDQLGDGEVLPGGGRVSVISRLCA
jgi:hypothetical protein